MAENPKALSGDVPDELPHLKEHIWEGSTRGQPAWVNSFNGDRTCTVCGCTLLSEGAVVNADRQLTSGRRYVYRDVLNKTVTSFQPLSCPVFVGDAASAAAQAKETARETKIETAKTQKALNAVEARIVQLEQENKALREQVGTVTQIDLTMLAQKLLELAQVAKENQALKAVQTEEGVYQVPKELVDVIDIVGVPVSPKALPPKGTDK